MKFCLQRQIQRQMTNFRLFIGKISQGWYVEYRDENGVRKRVYDGKNYGMAARGNAIKDIKQRKLYFKELYQLVIGKPILPLPEVVENKRPSTSISLQNALEIVLNSKRKILMPRSMVILERTARVFIAFVGNIPLSDVAPRHVLLWTDSMTIADQSINSLVRDLRTLFAYLVQLDYIKTNPCQNMKARRVKDAKSNEAYTPAELKLVMEACKFFPNLYVIACFMYAAFLRPSETIRMKRKHIDFERNIIVLPAKIRKTNFDFVMPLTQQLKNDLILYGKNLLNPDDFIITNGWNKPVGDGYFSTAFFKIKVANPTIISKHQTLYSIRHTAACEYFQKTQNLSHLSKLMGHTSINTTIIYLRSLGRIVGDISSDSLLEY